MCGVGVAVTEVQKKIHNLRSQFLNSTKNIQNKGKSGAGVEDVKKWKFFNAMQFLAPFVGRNVSTSTITNFSRESVSAFLLFWILLWVDYSQ